MKRGNMDAIKTLQKKLFIQLGILLIFISVVSFFLMDEPLNFVIGLAFGAATSILNFLELSNTLKRAVLMVPAKAQSFVAMKYFIRYAVTAIVLFISIVAPYINVLGTIVGLILLKGIILVNSIHKGKLPQKY